jgi:acyl-[acyl-carrier-protein]-phospholipid O-acyltransferase / long-chain-fatty-acid--[acyl-carrier-protein] ligase
MTAAELHVRGPNLMSGYYRHDAPGVLEPPSSAAGDRLAQHRRCGGAGCEWLRFNQGRLKRFAKVAGEMVSLEVVEAIARAASGEATTRRPVFPIRRAVN